MGFFFSFEGIDCSGKTTLIDYIYHELTLRGFKVLVTREPGGTMVAEKIRQILLDKENKEMHRYTEMLLYAASRCEHVYNKIIPALKEDYIVLTDRFLDSSLAYQSYGRGIDFDIVLGANSLVLNYLPNKTFFIDIKPSETIDRLNLRLNSADRLELEPITFHDRVYEGYLDLVNLYEDRFIKINGTSDLESLKDTVLKIILEILEDVKTSNY